MADMADRSDSRTIETEESSITSEDVGVEEEDYWTRGANIRRNLLG